MISGQNKNLKLISNEFIGTIPELDKDKKHTCIRILDSASVWNK